MSSTKSICVVYFLALQEKHPRAELTISGEHVTIRIGSNTVTMLTDSIAVKDVIENIKWLSEKAAKC